jgi:flagellar protein FliS
MKLNNATAHYKAKDAMTASQPALILMTYDAALRFTKEAQKYMEEGNIPAKGRAVESAFACVAELRRALDTKRGGDVASSLGRLYDYMTDQITRANFANDPSLLEPVKTSLETLREGWQEAIEKLRQDGRLSEYETPQSAGLLVR